MKQHEYQEALDLISNMNTMNLLTIGERSLTKPCVDKLQQLIDKLPYWLELEEKEKPMKPIEYDGQIPWVSYNCPNCLWTISSVMKESYCETCGQKIDWSDEE